MDPAPTTRPVPRPIAWVDGRVVPAREATVPLLDDGFLRGDAVFDAMLVRGGRTHAREPHLARLRASARALGIRVPALGPVIADLLAAWGDHDGALKIVLTRAGSVRGLVQHLEHPPTLSLHVVRIPWGGPLTSVKTTSYAANQWVTRQARSEHADDGLVVDDGIVLEVPTAAVCLVRDGVVTTPDPQRVPILDSVTVRELESVVEVRRDVVTEDDLAAADEVFVASATRTVLPVHAIDDRELAAPGPVTERLAAAFDDHIARTLDPGP